MMFLLLLLLTTTIATFPLWSYERGAVCKGGPTSDRDDVSKPLETDGKLKRVDVITDGDLQPGGQSLDVLTHFAKFDFLQRPPILTISIVVLGFDDVVVLSSS